MILPHAGNKLRISTYITVLRKNLISVTKVSITTGVKKKNFKHKNRLVYDFLTIRDVVCDVVDNISVGILHFCNWVVEIRMLAVIAYGPPFSGNLDHSRMIPFGCDDVSAK